MVKKIVLGLVFITLLTGCLEDSKEIDQRTIVLGMGIDKIDEDEIQLSLQMPVVVRPMEGEGEIDHSEFVTVTTSAPSLWEALTDLEAQTPTVLFFGHLKTVIISERLAKGGIDEVIDFIDRRSPIDNQVHLLIASDVDAILNSESQLVFLPSLYIERFFESDQKLSRTDIVRLFEYRRDTNMISKSATIPLIYSENNLTIQDFAVFKGDKMVDILYGKEAGFSRLLKEKQLRHINYTLTVPVPTNEAENVEVSISLNLNLIFSILQHQPPKFNLDLDGNIEFIHLKTESVDLTDELIDALKIEVKKVVKEDILHTINKMQESRTEPWLFGHRIWIDEPEDFDEEQWLNNEWPTAEFVINIDLEVEKIGQRGMLDKIKVGR
ncbi:Ger(x)C family spore germination protein [Salipaludibacillus agaradhaerens]|uniref:Ger(x)C family spore germination protein n=1 Tax=Salipaludibacillus agaradhaerens TaxID=76935 RepID=UPI0009985D5A|nr:Ger(x)C family spore germination protein [Salipaludibacillus agaradhaerens]